MIKLAHLPAATEEVLFFLDSKATHLLPATEEVLFFLDSL